MKKNKQKRIVHKLLLIFLLLTLSGCGLFRPPVVSLVLIDHNLSAQGYSQAEITTLKAALKPDQLLELSVIPYQPYALQRMILPHYLELIGLGYSDQEALTLSSFDNEQLAHLIQRGYIPSLMLWLKTPCLILDRLDRYLAYAQAHPALSMRECAERVNTDQDYAPYTHTSAADLNASIILVNKYHDLASTYVPPDLVRAQGCGKPTLTKAAAQAYDLMCADIIKAGLFMNEATSYRSYVFQADLYANYVRAYGQSYADSISARPGFSEHQTGLAIDLNTGDPSFSVFVTTKTYQWVVKNCTKYGFILRYPQGKQAVTGYRFEPWHYRYVGIALAQAISTSGLTLDEYALLHP